VLFLRIILDEIGTRRYTHAASVTSAPMSAIASPLRDGLMIFSSRSLHALGAVVVSVRTHRFKHAIAIGWIPYVMQWRHIKDSSIHKYLEASVERTFLKQIVMRMMCKSGNPQPGHEVYQSPSALKEFLKTKEYRGALCIEDVEICREGEGTPRLAHSPTSLGDEAIGYTAFPVLWGWFCLRRFTGYLKGHGRDYPRPLNGFIENPSLAYDPDDTSRVTFIHKVSFHACKMESIALRPVFGVDLPFAWIEIKISVDFNKGDVIYNLTGSAIPSRYALVTRAPESRIPLKFHSMLSVKRSAVKGFFECRDKEAPEYPSSGQ
jgi:hypothetical protein